MQAAQISDLETQIKVIEAKISSAPPDQTAELRKALELQKTTEEEIAALESKVAELDAAKRDLAEELESYRKKYVTPNQ